MIFLIFFVLFSSFRDYLGRHIIQATMLLTKFWHIDNRQRSLWVSYTN